MDPDPAPATADAVARAMALLEAGIPLTLLIDLVDPAGPRSAELLEHEQAPGSVWLRPARR